MHTSLRVTGVLSGLELSVVGGFGFLRWDAAQPVHDSVIMVPHRARFDGADERCAR